MDAARFAVRGLVATGWIGAARRGVLDHRVLLLSGVIALIVIVVGIVAVAQGGSPTGGHREGAATSVLALISVALTLAYLGLFVALHLLPTGLNPVHHAVSDYAVGGYGCLFRAGLYASSVGVLALAFALMKGVGSPPLPAARNLAYLLLIPLTRIGMTLFPTSLKGQRLTRTGFAHYVFGRVRRRWSNSTGSRWVSRDGRCATDGVQQWERSRRGTFLIIDISPWSSLRSIRQFHGNTPAHGSCCGE